MLLIYLFTYYFLQIDYTLLYNYWIICIFDILNINTRDIDL